MNKTLIRFFTKGGIFMFAANCIMGFVTDGAKTFRDAAKGRYNQESEAIQELREEMFGESSTTSDAQNLRRDRMMVGRDVRASYNKIVAENGQTTA